MDSIYKFAWPVGRIIMGLYFVMAGLGKFQMGVEGFAGFIGSQIPALTFLAVPVILFEILAGLALVVGFRTREAALLIAGFCLFTGFIYHGPADMMGMMKNIALAGGYFVLAGVGAGIWSLDNRKA